MTAEGFLARLATQTRQWICGLGGHDALLHFENERISLLCTSCGHQTPGWEAKGSPLTRRAERLTAAHEPVAARPSRVIHMPAARERRVA
jgi:hypothetical protein